MVGGGTILQMQDTFTGGRGDTTAARDLQSKEGEDTTDARHLHWWEGGGEEILLLQEIFTGRGGEDTIAARHLHWWGGGGGLLLKYN